jgi:hypothetical protein
VVENKNVAFLVVGNGEVKAREKEQIGSQK